MPRKVSYGHEKANAMQKLTLFFFEHAKLTLTLWIAALVFGALSYGVLMKREGFPDVAVPVGSLSAQYLANDAAVVDRDVAEPLSRVIASVDGVESVRSTSLDNGALLFMQYDESLSSSSGNERVRQAVESAGVTPASATLRFQTIEATKFNNEFDLLVSVFSPQGATPEGLRTDADRLAALLTDAELVDEAEVIEQTSTGRDPLTNQEVKVQTSFDRVTTRVDGVLDSYPSIVVGITAANGADTLALSDSINSTVEEFNNSDDLNSRAVIVADFAESIRSQVSTLQESLLEGFMIVLVVSFVLISWRAGVVTSVSMVTVLTITVGALYAFGITLNTITLFALILCLGLIVDDTTIMVEALDASHESKRSKAKTAAIVVKKVALASVAGTLTTMLGFAPLLFVSGILGDFIRVLPITIIISLAVSLIVSLTLVPFLAKYVMLGRSYDESKNPVHHLEEYLSGAISRLILSMKNNYRRLIILPALAIGLSITALVIGGFFFGRLKFDIFPTTKDSNTLQAQLQFAPGTTVEAADTLSSEVDAIIIRKFGDYVERITYSGQGTERQAVATIELVDYESRDKKAPEIAATLEEELQGQTDFSARVIQLGAGPPREEFPFKLQILSDDINAAQRLAGDMKAHAEQVSLTRADGSAITIDRIQIAPADVKSRVDGELYTQLEASFTDDDTSAVVTALKEELVREFDEDRLKGYGFTVDDIRYDFGAESQNQESFQGVLVAFPILLAAMYLLLLLQFRSFVQPILIFMAIPFSFLGVGLGLYLTDNPLSFFVMVALFALIGVAVNNTILLTDYANQARREGLGRIDSIARAINERFRPLVVTSVTSVVALIPLALSDPFWESLAVTLIFGLLSSTLIVIIAFPYYYLVFEWLRVSITRKELVIWLLATLLIVLMLMTIGLSPWLAAVFVPIMIVRKGIKFVVKTKQ